MSYRCTESPYKIFYKDFLYSWLMTSHEEHVTPSLPGSLVKSAQLIEIFRSTHSTYLLIITKKRVETQSPKLPSYHPMCREISILTAPWILTIKSQCVDINSPDFKVPLVVSNCKLIW